MTSDDQFDKFARECKEDSKEMRISIAKLAESMNKMVVEFSHSNQKHDRADERDKEFRAEIKEIREKMKEIEIKQGKGMLIARIIIALSAICATSATAGVVSYMLYLIEKIG